MTHQPISILNNGHIPVLMQEAIQGLNVQENGIYIDCTFGGGGYSHRILESQNCQVYGIDRDPDAVARGKIFEEYYPGRFEILEGKFSDIKGLLKAKSINSVNGIVFDLGVSSFQIDTVERGFSFRENGPLDMRMDLAGKSAADYINTLPQGELASIFYEYGEEKKSRAVAKAITAARKIQKIATTQQLADIIRPIVGRDKSGIDPATRCFMGLRIFVNDELKELSQGLEEALKVLKPKGRLAVVSFHSLEDRIVKQFFKEKSERKDQVSRHLPAVPAFPNAELALVTRRPLTPSLEETHENPRARSAKLRIAERLTLGIETVKNSQPAMSTRVEI